MPVKSDWWLLAFFLCYTVATATMFLLFPQILGQPYLMPWDYWWVFLLVTPSLAGGVLGYYALEGRFSLLGVVAFTLASAVLGLFYGWVSYQLAAVV